MIDLIEDESNNQDPLPEYHQRLQVEFSVDASPVLEEIVKRKCKEAQVSIDALNSPSRCRNLAVIRAAVSQEAYDAGVSLSEIAKRFRRSPSVVYRTMQHYRAIGSTDSAKKDN